MISFLAGYFEIVFLTIFMITFHEIGHFITGYLLGLKVDKIKIFMFGGVTNLKENLNLDIKKEIITLLMGPIFQVLLVLLINLLCTKGLVNISTCTKINNINKILLSFNLLPILPLDGGKLLNNILDYILPYNLSHKITIIISLLSLPLIFIFDNKLFVILILIFLILNILDEINIHKYKLKKLILERQLKYIKFKKSNKIKSETEIKRNKNFNILINGIYLDEYNYYELLNKRKIANI